MAGLHVRLHSWSKSILTTCVFESIYSTSFPSPEDRLHNRRCRLPLGALGRVDQVEVSTIAMRSEVWTTAMCGGVIDDMVMLWALLVGDQPAYDRTAWDGVAWGILLSHHELPYTENVVVASPVARSAGLAFQRRARLLSSALLI